MTGTEINLNQMLTRRENRAYEQNLLLNKYNCPVISFCMNIPGPIKTNEKIKKAFDDGKNLLLEKLNDLEINNIIEIHESTGDELILSVNARAEILKNIAVNIEENFKVGRLFDIDIINTDGKKLSREIYRKCLICNNQAQECARSRKHDITEMQKAVENLLRDYNY